LGASTVVKFGENDEGGGYCTGCFGIEVRADPAKLTTVIIARYGER